MRFSASSAALLARCQYWARDDVEIAETESTPEMRRGSALSFLSDCFIRGRLCSVEGAADKFRLDDQGKAELTVAWNHASEWLYGNKRRHWTSETPFAIDTETGIARLLPGEGREAYAQRVPTEYCGSPDICVPPLDGEEEIVIYDWKWAREVEKYWPQLALLAAMAARIYGASSARIVILQISEAGIRTFERQLDAFDLAAMSGTYAALVAGIPAAEPTPGQHCAGLYCKAIAGCPAVHREMAELVPANALVRHKFSTEIECREHAEWMLPRVTMMAAAIESLRDALKKYSREHNGIVTSDGKVWRAVPVTKTQVKARDLEALARRLGGTDEDIGACSYQTSYDQFREVKA